MTGGGLEKNGVSHKVFLTENGREPNNIASERGVKLFYYSGII
jgi:hypothetical protein